MIHRKYIIALVLGVALAAFGVGASLYQSRVHSKQVIRPPSSLSGWCACIRRSSVPARRP